MATPHISAEKGDFAKRSYLYRIIWELIRVR